MTNHIEEMLKTAGLEGEFYATWDSQETQMKNFQEWTKYPDFTAEKQLEIIKLIIDKCHTLDIFKGWAKGSIYYFGSMEEGNMYRYNGRNKDFTQALAQLTTELMNAGELDKSKLKEILEG